MFETHNSWTYRKPIKWYMKTLRFLAQCQDVDIQTQLKEYNFFGGNRKYDGKVVYNFKTAYPSLIDLYSSVTSLFDNDNKYLRVLDDWFPRLYALLKNKKNLKEYVDTEDTYLFYDFVNIN